MSIKVLTYFNHDTIASDTWQSKYQVKDNKGYAMEGTPHDMHLRMAEKFAVTEIYYQSREVLLDDDMFDSLSSHGKRLTDRRKVQNLSDITTEIFSYFDHFRQIIPQGSIMSNLGNKYSVGSLSNCFGVESPFDSYAGIMKTDEELAHLMKRRGGVGINLSTLRPSGSVVKNTAKSSVGVVLFAERYSNTTREVGQEGRRGALMELLHVGHPDIFKFVTMKDDKAKVTGANVSVMLTHEFMQAVDKNTDFVCTFPVDKKITPGLEMVIENIPYNTLVPTDLGVQVMKIRARELFDLIAEMAWKNAEPGIVFIDSITDYSSDGVYDNYKPTVCNPCAEQWFHDYETCRLIAMNMFSIVAQPFTAEAHVDYDKLYDIAYMQQRLGDDLVDLELEYIRRIIDKIDSDPEPEDIKSRERGLWTKIFSIARDGRRTGSGFTGLGDMLAALGVGYGTERALEIVTKVMHMKMKAELDCMTDMALTRGTFTGWDPSLEHNSFFSMLREEFPAEGQRMQEHGRRNVSWSTVAPTGTVSIMTQTTGGLEPLFKGFYIRRKKINPSDIGYRVDFTDQNGDKWQEYTVLHPKFRDWIQLNSRELLAIEGELDFDLIDKNMIQEFFKQSPWYGSEAANISYDSRIRMQAAIQKYTSNSISSTVNLSEDTDRGIVKAIYFKAWKAGLKGITVYREGSRTGVLVDANPDKFNYNNATKRPKTLEAQFHFVKSGTRKYAVIVGLFNNKPYELFAFENPIVEGSLQGTITKVHKNEYKFNSTSYNIQRLELSSELKDEKLLTRWVSLALRHGANPKFIVEQVDKSDMTITTFAKAISRVLKLYIPDEHIINEACSQCGEDTIVYQEGCKRCTSCGYSKC